MKPKLLILPSWYISPKDRINGSFFQSQASVMSDDFEIRALYVQERRRPSIRNLMRKPLEATGQWLDFFRFRGGKCTLPDEEIFRNPELHRYEKRLIPFPWRSRREQFISYWIRHVRGMVRSGWRPDLIHAHSAYPAGVVASLVKSEFGIPYVITEHLPFSILDFEPAFRSKISEAFRNADAVLSLGYDKLRQLAMSRIEAEPNIIFNLVEADLFRGLANGYMPGQPLRLVTVGAASFYKDHKTLLRAVHQIKIMKIPFHLTMIGLNVWGLDKLDETLGLIDELGLTENIKVVGIIERSELAALLPNYHIFLNTSIQEGCAVSVLEALASGLFVISTRHGGIEDYFTEQMGRLVPIREHRMIAKNLSALYNGEIIFEPARIRSAVLDVCGPAAFRARLRKYYFRAMGRACESLELGVQSQSVVVQTQP